MIKEVPKIVTRLEKLQNSSKSLSWGHSVNDDFTVLCCGHNCYWKKTLTLVVRPQSNGMYFVESDDCDGCYAFLVLGTEDEVVSSVIDHLKELYPEIRS